MANIVHNNLQIIGPTAEEILNKLEAEGFEAFVPKPKDLPVERALDWGYSNWGTKWDRYTEGLERYDDGLLFMTANGEADEFVIRLERMFPENIYILTWRTEDDGFKSIRNLYKKGDTWIESEGYTVSLTDIYDI
jgi:hypothetical protein